MPLWFEPTGSLFEATMQELVCDMPKGGGGGIFDSLTALTDQIADS